MMRLFRLSSNFIWAFYGFVATLFHQLLFQLIKGMELKLYAPSKLLIIYGFFFIFSLTKSTLARWFLSSFVIILAMIQMIHLSYYGTQIMPVEIWLLFLEIHEVSSSLAGDIQHIIMPLLITLPLLKLLWWTNKRIQPLSVPYVPVLISIYFLYNPVRTFITGNTWGRQPSDQELYGMNTYLSLSYFFGRILPAKLQSHGPDTHASNSSMKLTLTPTHHRPFKNVIFIMGESLTPHHLSIFGYHRETTPFLNSLKEDPHFYYQKAVSGGVSTDISVAFLFNSTFGKSAQAILAKGERCWFRLAKAQGFKTFFISSQSSQQLRYITPYICPQYVDIFSSLDQLAPEIQDANTASDDIVVPYLEKYLKDESPLKFIVLNMRGSHSPYALRSRDQFKIFKNLDSRTDDYDNSVLEFDHYMKKVIEVLSPGLKDSIVIYVSDHGEGLGEAGVWGHGPLLYPSYVVPLFIYAKDVRKWGMEHFPTTGVTTHFNLSLYMMKLIGFESNISSSAVIPDYEIYGNDIDGFAGSIGLNPSEPLPEPF